MTLNLCESLVSLTKKWRSSPVTPRAFCLTKKNRIHYILRTLQSARIRCQISTHSKNAYSCYFIKNKTLDFRVYEFSF